MFAFCVCRFRSPAHFRVASAETNVSIGRNHQIRLPHPRDADAHRRVVQGQYLLCTTFNLFHLVCASSSSTYTLNLSFLSMPPPPSSAASAIHSVGRAGERFSSFPGDSFPILFLPFDPLRSTSTRAIPSCTCSRKEREETQVLCIFIYIFETRWRKMYCIYILYKWKDKERVGGTKVPV